MNDLLSGWWEMIAALTVFFVSHILPARPLIRHWLRERLGGAVYMALYSGLSIGVLAWLISAAGRAPYVEIWAFEPWQLWAPFATMPLACLMIALGVAVPNPFSIAGLRNDLFEADKPGIVGVTRHPLIWALVLWSLGHMVPNGDLAHVIMFSLFAIFGLGGMLALDKRRQREWSYDVWSHRARRTSFFPFFAIFTGKVSLTEDKISVHRLIAAACLYLTLLMSHESVIGVMPLPSL